MQHIDGSNTITTLESESAKLGRKIRNIQVELCKLRAHHEVAIKKKQKEARKEDPQSLFVDSSDDDYRPANKDEKMMSLNIDELSDLIYDKEKKLQLYRRQHARRLKRMILDGRRRAGDDVESDATDIVCDDYDISSSEVDDDDRRDPQEQQGTNHSDQDSEFHYPWAIYKVPRDSTNKEEDTDEGEEDEKIDETNMDTLEGGLQLMAMARKGQDEDVIRILNKDSDLVQFKDPNGNSVLHVVARLGKEETVKQLLNIVISDAIPNCWWDGNNDGDTALHLALKKGHRLVASLLIRARPQVAYERNKQGISPLYMSVKANHRDLVIQLFQEMSGSSVIGQKRKELLRAGKWALVHAAIKASNLKMVHTLLDNMPFLIDSSNEKGWKPLSYAAFKGRVSEAMYLIQNYPESIEKCDEDGSFPIHKAVVGDDVSIFKEILSTRRETTLHVDQSGQSVINYAVKYASENVLPYLKRKQKNPKKMKSLQHNKGDNKGADLVRNIHKR